VVFLGSARAQDVPRLNLSVKDALALTEPDQPILGQTRCDTAGNLYVRYYQPTNVLGAPVVKISAEGKRAALFSLQSVSGFSAASMKDFSVGLRGEVHVLAARTVEDRFEIDIVTFREDATFASTTAVGLDLVPEHISAFPSGELLISGWRARPADASAIQRDKLAPVDAFLAVVNPDGKVAKEVGFPARAGSDGAPGAPGEGIDRSEVSLGGAAAGEDGNVYLLRRSSKPVVYVISPSGDLVRTLRVTPPSEGAEPATVKISTGNRLLLEFLKPAPGKKQVWNTETYSLVDGESGERLIDYLAGPEISGSLACYTPNGFTFLGSAKDGRPAILRAVPR